MINKTFVNIFKALATQHRRFYNYSKFVHFGKQRKKS